MKSETSTPDSLAAPDGSANPSTGWVIIHPSGHLEMDYFHSDLSYNKYDLSKPITREEWMRRYRPDCELRRATITFLPDEKLTNGGPQNER